MPLPSRGLHGLALLIAVCTCVLIFAGGLVTSTGSGLAVPDWPLSYGTLFPPMVGGVFYEHGHRLVAGTVALLTLVCALWAWRSGARPRVRWLAAAALLTVVCQAILGGITVLWLLPTAVSVAHAGLANVYFCLVAALVFVTSPARSHHRAVPAFVPSGLRAAWVALVVAVYGQIILGAWMRHSGAGLAIPDFPLAFGHLVPPFERPGVALHFAHRIGGLVVTSLAAVLLHRSLRAPRHAGTPRAAATGLALLVAAQILLGGLTVWLGRPVLVTTLHVTAGSLILALSVWGALRAFVLLPPGVGSASPRPRAPAIPHGEPA